MADETTVVETPATEAAAPAVADATTTEQAAAAAAAEQAARDAKGRFSKPPEERIAEITRKHREQERETEYWRRRAEAQSQQAAAPKAAEKPTPDKFDDYGAYVEALADWKANEIVDKKLTTREREAEQRRSVTDRDTKFRERLEKTREGITDYEQVMEAAADMRVSDHVSDLIKESDLGAKLLYHFAKNPEALERLNTLTLPAAAREIGRIEARIESRESEATKELTQEAESTSAAAAPVIRQTKAPPPTKPLQSGRSTTPDLQKAGMDEYVKQRSAQGARWARR